ncbi:hypothetical protein ACH5RR_015632 [Cinchona calisaya]|uniref:Uncharacterized protein n=1 Tax=Cinchona calisaya TaxID=153742 RepID=A0ABD2ZZ33_9GENT
MLEKLQKQDVEALSIFEEKMLRERNFAMSALKKELDNQHLSEVEGLRWTYAQVSEDLKAVFAEVRFHKSGGEKLKAKLYLLKACWANREIKLPLQGVNNFLSSTALANDLTSLCQEVHRFGFKDAVDFVEKEHPNNPMIWSRNEWYDP